VLAVEEVKSSVPIELTRDELGIKPVYYVHDGSSITYDDHIGAILKVRSECQPNKDSIRAYLKGGHPVHSEETFFEGVRRLLPGQKLISDPNGRAITSQYWIPQFSKTVRNETGTGAAAEKTRELLLEAVESNIREEKDVIGVSLSGGLDSSSIVACVRKLRPNARIKTFSVISDGNNEDARCSEMVVQKLGTEQTIVKPNAEEFWNDLRIFVRCQEEPVTGIDTYCDWKMHERAKDTGLTKLLGGTGSDALLMGDPALHPHYWLTLMERKEYRLLLANLLGSYEIALRLLWRIMIQPRKGPERTAGQAHELTERARDDLLIEMLASNLRNSIPTDLQCLYNNAAYFGIEPLSPFLYMPLVEYLLTLPLDCKIHRGTTKYILREAMKPLLPEAVVKRKSKDVFANPTLQWFNGPLREKLQDFFSSQSLRGTEYYNLSRVHELLGKNMDRSEGRYVWRVLNLEVWLQEFF
jgi:asparagine synthase (glutamine-hydrolysing)